MQCCKAFGSFPHLQMNTGVLILSISISILDMDCIWILIRRENWPPSCPQHASREIILVVATKRSYPEIYIALTVPAVRNKVIVSKEVSPPYVSAKAPWSHEDSCFLSAVEVHA